MATFVKIASVEVGSGGASTIDFTSIPQTYTDLKVVLSSRAITGSFPNPLLRFNADSANNYRYRGLYGDGSSAASNNSTSTSSALLGATTGSSQTASVFGNLEVYIPNYTSSNQKSLSVESVAENNSTTNYLYLVANLWTGTSAITSISLSVTGNFAQYSTATLYGILKA